MPLAQVCVFQTREFAMYQAALEARKALARSSVGAAGAAWAAGAVGAVGTLGGCRMEGVGTVARQVRV